MFRIKYLLLVGSLFLGFLGSPGHGLAAPKPVNKVVIIIDGSGSYKNRQTQAITRAVALLEEMSQAKVRRWEQSDEITVISLDAMPDVIFQGSLTDLKKETPAAWVERFKARSDYLRHTDITGAFNLALRRLEGDSRYVTKYIIAFTDLIHDPIRGPAPKKGKPVPPPEDFPFAELEDVAVAVLWCPYKQRESWEPFLQEHGLEDSFHIYTNSESGAIKLSPPPKARVKREAGELESQRQWLLAKVTWLAQAMVYMVAAIFGLPLLALLCRQIWRWRRPRGGNLPSVPQR